MPDRYWSPADDRDLSGISSDSREIKPGFLFFAIPGVHVDGHAFIPAVIKAGAAAVVHEAHISDEVRRLAAEYGTTLVRVDHARTVLSHAAANWFDNPSNDLVCIGVTGTDGKSSTCYYIHQLLEAAGMNSGFFSTVAMQAADAVIPNDLRQSTPEALELHAVLARMRENGKRFAVIETTSHGLSHQTARLRDVPFQVAVFTNLSHEHLEFHGSYEQYRSDKANLFRELVAQPGKAGFGVINFGDKEAPYFAAASALPVVSYGSELCPVAKTRHQDSPLNLFADTIVAANDFTDFVLHFNPGAGILSGNPGRIPVRLPLPGTFNVENIMAALAVVSGLICRSPLDLVPLLTRIRSIKGRMLPIKQGQAFSVIVDYAHTPGAFSTVFPVFRQGAKKRLIAVFGSAGERDREKRPMQGRLAAEFCDILVLTNEDPRLEDEMSIINQIAAGAQEAQPAMVIHRICDRREAIKKAFQLAMPGDLVVLLGKGHEQCIIYPDGKRPWDEETVAREVLEEMGFRSKT